MFKKNKQNKLGTDFIEDLVCFSNKWFGNTASGFYSLACWYARFVGLLS